MDKLDKIINDTMLYKFAQPHLLKNMYHLFVFDMNTEHMKDFFFKTYKTFINEI